MLFILLLTCIASDIGGYVIGKILKGPKITKISPKKTFSGALGSILFSIITLLVLIYYTLNIFDYKLILIAIITSSTNQLGDLLFSYLKRKAKIKNTGNFLPGHGGILDRLDGILIGLPIGYVSLIFVF
jgi:phosphatidate cytidylyltransferase